MRDNETSESRGAMSEESEPKACERQKEWLTTSE